MRTGTDEMGERRRHCPEGKFHHPETEKLFCAFVDRYRYSALGALVKGIVHNLNGSLQVLSMQMELLQAGLLKESERIDPSVCERMEKCLGHVDRLKGMVEVLMHQGAHDEQEDSQDIRLNELLEEKLSLLHHDPFFKHQLRVKRTFFPQLPPLKGYYVDFSEGLLGLIRNAMEAMEETLQKEMTVVTKVENHQVWVAIKDTGCGISEESRRHLFTPFFTTKGGKHYGLGLFLAKELLTPYGASFDYASGNGETVFSVGFPLNTVGLDSLKGKGR
ncbi:MAG TPA: HAMP domain-containing sensor histidine kinase [Thermodesulfobacteriota bacterium]|nr:HAMP domain-containing sensor histidine kinase [Thermodesulfobacteriota bacterium]